MAKKRNQVAASGAKAAAPNEWSFATEAEDIGRELIREHHPHLTNSKIVYLFRTEAVKKNGKTLAGSARKVSGLSAFLASEDPLSAKGAPFFVIEIWKGGWDKMEEPKHLALVDHCLCRCWVEDDKLSLHDPDVEEFAAVIHRHGLYRQDVEDFAKVAATKLQPALDIPS